MSMTLSEEEALTPSVERRPRRWVWAGLVGVVTLGVVAAVAVSRPQKRSSMDKFADVVREFSLRVLKDEPDFKASGSFTWNEEGADVPSTTGVNIVLQPTETEGDGSGPVLKAIFLAQEGKGADLAEQLNKALAVFCKQQSGEYGEEAEQGCKQMLTIEQVEKADEAAITFKLPPGQGPSVDEMANTLKGSPKVEMEIFVGRSIKDMFDNRKDTPLPLMPNGLKASFDIAVPGSMLTQVAEEQHMEKENMLFRGLASESMKLEMLYKSEDDLGSAWDKLPTSEQAWNRLMSMANTCPESVLVVLHGLDEVADGLKSVSLSNLPVKNELVAKFTNFKVSEVVKALLDAEPPTPWYSQ